MKHAAGINDAFLKSGRTAVRLHSTGLLCNVSAWLASSPFSLVLSRSYTSFYNQVSKIVLIHRSCQNQENKLIAPINIVVWQKTVHELHLRKKIYSRFHYFTEKRDRSSSQISTFWETWRGGRFWCSRRRGASPANAWSATTTGSSSSWLTSPTASLCPTTCTATSKEGSRSGSASSRRGCSCTPSLTTSELRLLSKHSHLTQTADSSAGSPSVPVPDQFLNVALTQVHATWWSSGPSRADFGELPAEASKDSEEAAVPLWWENFCLALFQFV